MIGFRFVTQLSLVLVTFTLIGATIVSGAGASGGESEVPDLTKGGKPDNTHDWLLGPTGARGWMAAHRQQTTDSRQILVTHVDANSPAVGALREGDVILGIDDEPFNSDARIAFGKAITRAEAGKGKLKLIRWRPGGDGGEDKTESVILELKVMGAYSSKAPYECKKSEAIFAQGCKEIARRGLNGMSIPNDLNALALLASGDKEYHPMLAEYAKLVGRTLKPPMWWWNYAYGNLFLAEYYLATKDENVLPLLRESSMEIARWQSPTGTWGHEHTTVNGFLRGYGCINQIGLTLTTSLIAARKVGVEDPSIDKAIAKQANFIRWYVNKGSLPYGDHSPWMMEHDNNGVNAIAATMYDLLGDREEATYFSKMATAAHSEREAGHTGNFFNMLWAAIGVSRAGPYATGGHFKEISWYYDLARTWKGSFVYPDIPASNGSYRNWDCTGAYLLSYALQRKSLLILGKEPGSAEKLSKKAAAEVIDAGRHFSFWKGDASYDDMSDDELFERLQSWSPIVRIRAARSISHHEGDFSERLKKLLDGNDVNARYGACETIALLGPRAAGTVPRLREILKGDDPWMVQLAVKALATQSEETRKAVTDELLVLATREMHADPRRMVQRALAEAFFDTPRNGPKGILVESLAGPDPKLVFKAVSSILTNEDGRTRGKLRSVYAKVKNDEELAAMYLPTILEATRVSAPSGIMFADEIRMAGLDLMSELRIREGMPLCVSLMDPDRWGQERRYDGCIKSLSRYGGNAKEVLPQLKEVRQQIQARRGDADRKRATLESIDKLITSIESDKNPPELYSIANPAGKSD